MLSKIRFIKNTSSVSVQILFIRKIQSSEKDLLVNWHEMADKLCTQIKNRYEYCTLYTFQQMGFPWNIFHINRIYLFWNFTVLGSIEFLSR